MTASTCTRRSPSSRRCSARCDSKTCCTPTTRTTTSPSSGRQRLRGRSRSRPGQKRGACEEEAPAQARVGDRETRQGRGVDHHPCDPGPAGLPHVLELDGVPTQGRLPDARSAREGRHPARREHARLREDRPSALALQGVRAGVRHQGFSRRTARAATTPAPASSCGCRSVTAKQRPRCAERCWTHATASSRPTRTCSAPAPDTTTSSGASDRGMAHFIGMHFLLQIAIRLIHEMGRIEVYEQEYRKLLALMASTEPTIPADWPRIVSEGRNLSMSVGPTPRASAGDAPTSLC